MEESVTSSVIEDSRLAASQSKATLRCGGAVLDIDRRTVVIRQAPIALSPLECRMLATLFAAQSQVVHSDALVRCVWPDGKGNELNLRAVVGRVRQKLQPGCIETIGREGYRWAGRTPVPRPYA